MSNNDKKLEVGIREVFDNVACDLSVQSLKDAIEKYKKSDDEILCLCVTPSDAILAEELIHGSSIMIAVLGMPDYSWFICGKRGAVGSEGA